MLKTASPRHVFRPQQIHATRFRSVRANAQAAREEAQVALAHEALENPFCGAPRAHPINRTEITVVKPSSTTYTAAEEQKQPSLPEAEAVAAAARVQHQEPRRPPALTSPARS